MMTTILSPVSQDKLSVAKGEFVRISWQQQSPPPREFVAVACPEEDGGFSVFALHYPDVMSQGDDLEEAKANIAEAFLAVLQSRLAHGERMEFSNQPITDIPDNSERIRITLDG